MDDGLRKHDPYKELLDDGKQGTRPGFLGGTGESGPQANTDDVKAAKKRAKADAKAAQSAAASDDLRSGEDSVAEGGLYRPGGGQGDSGAGGTLANARQNEQAVKGLYSGKGKVVGGKKNKKGVKGFLKKGGPITAIILAVFLTGAVAFTGVSTELVSWKENISSMFGQNSAVINKRSNFLMRKLLTTHRSSTATNIFGHTKFKINAKLAQKLKEQNIYYVETNDANGRSVRMLVYEDANGRAMPVVASDGDLPRANSLAGSEINIDGRMVKLTEAAMTLNEARRSNDGFNKRFDAATILFAGKIAGWFDNMADAMYKRIIGSGARNQTAMDDPTEEKVNDMLLKNKSQGVDDSSLNVKTQEQDEDGNTQTRPAEASDSVGDGKTYGEVAGESDKMGTDNSGAPGDVKNKLSARAQKVAMLGSSIGCSFLRGIGAISVAIGALQTMNVIDYASKYLEISDKIKAGDADEVTNIAMNSLNDPVKTVAYDMDGNEVSSEKPVVQSDGWNAVFSTENVINENDPGALMSNRELSNKIALRSAGLGLLPADVISSVASFGGGIEAWQICNDLQFAMGIVDTISDVALIFTTAGIGEFVKEFIKGVIQGAVFAAAMIAVNSVIAAITPVVAQWFVSKLGNVFLGDNGGYALYSGSQNILSSNLQMSTGRYASKENAIEVFGLTKEAETEWARYERQTKSPFDITSKYTFMGSLVNAALPILNKAGGSVMSQISSIANLAGTSAIALASPTVSAASEVDNFAASLASDSNCGYLSSVKVAGTFACGKYAGAYVNEISSWDSEDIYNKMAGEYGSFSGEDADGNPKINKDSDYAKYIVACVSSDTQPGTMNGAVEGFIQKNTQTDSILANGLINFGQNFIPFSGILDTIDAGEQQANFTWNSGAACTGNTGDAALNEKVKYFSMYNLDQRVLHDMGIIETNSTVAFLDEYYEENPLDETFEGRIAQFSGLTKDQVSDTLALMEYYDFVANYDASTRYAFGAPVVEVEEEMNFEREDVMGGAVVLAYETVYADVRNRNFAV